MSRRGRTVSVAITDGSIEIATGYSGRGVFLTPVSARGRRWVTMRLGWVGALRLAEILRLAGEAARDAERDRAEPSA